MKKAVVVLAALLCASVATRARAEISFTECGGTVPAHQTGVLENDVVCQYRCANDPSIVCNGDDDAACSTFCEADEFRLERGARLELNGHHVFFAYQAAAVGCQDSHPGGRCTIVGPGGIDGGKGTGVWARGMDMVLENVAITFTDAAINVDRRLFATGLTILADRENTVFASRGAHIEDSTVDGEAGLYSGGDLVIKHSRIGPHAGAVATGRVRGRHVTIRGGAGIGGSEVELKRVEVITGPDIIPVSLISSTGALSLKRSHVRMIESASSPILDRSTCSKSFHSNSQTSWGVCADD